MDAFTIDELETTRRDSGRLYHEFLRVPAMSAGVYALAAGARDPQRPHTEDEIYVVMAGRGRISVGDEDRDVGPGSIVFVAAGVEHRFHDITQDLSIVVAFSPAESL